VEKIVEKIVEVPVEKIVERAVETTNLRRSGSLANEAVRTS